MNEIKTSPISDLTIGDVFTTQGHGPYVVVNKRTMDNMTTVDYRNFYNGLPRDTPFSFTRVNLSTCTILDRFYGPELYTKNVEV